MKESSDSRPIHRENQRIYLFTCDAVRQVDQAAVDEFGLPGLVLMENASRALFDEVIRLLQSQPSSSSCVLICCGKGNNGGDGLALARHLSNEGINVEILLTYNPDQGLGPEESATNLHTCQAMKLPIHILDCSGPNTLQKQLDQLTGHDLIVDALLGTGSTSAPRPPLDHLITWINDQQTTILAVDIPSGMNGDTGQAPGPCINADVTVSFVGLKTGFFDLDAQEHLGEIVIGDIGVPFALIERYGEPLDTLEKEISTFSKPPRKSPDAPRR